MSFNEKARAAIGVKVRELRKARLWTQAELAAKLDLAQSSLSEIENGKGSFTAEQFLEILKLFNVTASSFAGPINRHADLQNALARAGAKHLLETEGLASEALADVRKVVVEAIIDGSSRIITSIAPVLVRNVDHLNVEALFMDLRTVGFQRRLGWVVDNTRFALETLPKNGPLRRRASLLLGRHTSLFLRELSHTSTARELDNSESEVLDWDVLDSTIRTAGALNRMIARSSSISKKWHIATTIQAEDFARAIAAAGLE